MYCQNVLVAVIESNLLFLMKQKFKKIQKTHQKSRLLGILSEEKLLLFAISY